MALLTSWGCSHSGRLGLHHRHCSVCDLICFLELRRHRYLLCGRVPKQLACESSNASQVTGSHGIQHSARGCSQPILLVPCDQYWQFSIFVFSDLCAAWTQRSHHRLRESLSSASAWLSVVVCSLSVRLVESGYWRHGFCSLTLSSWMQGVCHRLLLSVDCIQHWAWFAGEVADPVKTLAFLLHGQNRGGWCLNWLTSHFSQMFW